METRSVYIGEFSELYTKNPPKIKGFTTFSKISKRNFHGIGVYVRNHLRGYVLRVPDEDEELEIVHIIIKKYHSSMQLIWLLSRRRVKIRPGQYKQGLSHIKMEN